MPYSTKQVQQLDNERNAVLHQLQELMLQSVVHGQEASDARVREHLLHGVARRIRVLHRAVDNIFRIFPPSSSRPLSSEALSDVQISLHAFVMNLYGLFDNWAWAFVIRHKLDDAIGNRRGVGLFARSTQRYLPDELRQYLSQDTITKWHDQYLKSYRDALAHRIPLYIPPAEFTHEEGERYNALEAEKVACIKSMKWQRLDEVWEEQGAIGRPSFAFLHSFSEDGAPRPIILHFQVLSDSKAVLEFGLKFFEHWHERA